MPPTPATVVPNEGKRWDPEKMNAEELVREGCDNQATSAVHLADGKAKRRRYTSAAQQPPTKTNSTAL